MKVYIIMSKGAKIARNLDFARTMEFGKSKNKIWVSDFFWRKKDAREYLATLDYPHFKEIRTFEVI